MIMNKIFSSVLAAAAGIFALASCDAQTDIEAGGTAVQKVAGNWEVRADLADADGNVIAEDCYGIGTFTLYTYNTASNSSKEMWIDDRGNFWAFKFKVDVNVSKQTFSTSDYVPYDAAGTGNAKIVSGKVMYGAATNLHGMPNDSIAFLVTFDDDNPDTYYMIQGQRYTGFKE
jgi:hypothetical protein